MKPVLVAAALAAGLSLNATATAQAPPIASEPVLMMVHVRVAEMGRSERFYHDVFGMSVTNAVSAREHVLRFPNAPNTASGVILLLAGDTPQPNGGFLVQVPDIDATIARVAAAGGTVMRAPRDSGPGVAVRNALIKDPDGALIEVMQFIRR
jgi:predicted enzyme related to lactoylglutathione lyase